MSSKQEPFNGQYEALTITSPVCLGGETKDQDRVCWYGPGLVGAASDGTTASAYSGQAAEIVAAACPALFKGNIRERLAMICDLLMAKRDQAQLGSPSFPAIANPSMRKMLEEVARDRMRTSFQTTLVAVQLVPSEDAVLARCICCGDSAFFAFAGDGMLLSSSLAAPGPARPPGASCEADGRPGGVAARILLGPGDELRAEIVCDASERPDLAEKARIDKASAANWLVCLPVESAAAPPAEAPGRRGHPCIELETGELLLAPRYLAVFPDDLADRQYCRLPYSLALRRPSGPLLDEPSFEGRGSATAVLPDHFYTAGWAFWEERFGRDAHFVLASDGFYGCFSRPSELWRWLREHEEHLQDPSRRDEVIGRLHEQLNARQGDDDISFVWIRPAVAEAPAEDPQSDQESDHAG